MILIDKRGVGRSRPALACPEPARLPLEATDADVLDAFRRCAVRLRANLGRLSAFDTPGNVRDLDVVRQALGDERVNLYGTSYGARLAQQTLRGDPDWVRSVVLSSPVPPEANFVADGPRTFAWVLSRTYRVCQGAPACRQAFRAWPPASIKPCAASWRSRPW